MEAATVYLVTYRRTYWCPSCSGPTTVHGVYATMHAARTAAANVYRTMRREGEPLVRGEVDIAAVPVRS